MTAVQVIRMPSQRADEGSKSMNIERIVKISTLMSKQRDSQMSVSSLNDFPLPSSSDD